MAGYGRPLVVVWNEEDTEQALRAAPGRSGDGCMAEVAAPVGTSYRTVQRWVAWYRAGGLEAARTHRMGG